MYSVRVFTKTNKETHYLMAGSANEKRKYWANVLKQVSWLSQLGLSIIMPMLICVLICAFLTLKFDIGEWIFIPGFILGLGASFTTGYKFYVSESKKSEKDKDTRKRGYNNHY